LYLKGIASDAQDAFAVNFLSMGKVGLWRLHNLAAPIVLLAMAAQNAGSAQDASFAGYVFEFRGSWRIGPQYASDLALGQGVRNNDAIKLSSYRTDAFIKIGSVDKSVIARDCRQDRNQCKAEFTIKVDNADDGLSARLRSIWNHLTAPPPKAALFTASRGVGQASPKDAVIPLKSGMPDLAAALEDLDPGPLGVRLEPASGGSAIPLRVDWKKTGASVSGPPVQAGLYILSIREDIPDAPPATILIVDAGSAKKFGGDFAEAKRFSAGWPPQMAHTYLTAVLAELDRENGRGQ
jgi:hypothetical protein